VRAATLLLGAALAACAGESQALTVDELVYEVDVERVRALGWAAESSTDAEAVAAAAAMLERRLPLGKEVTLSLAEEPCEIRLDLGGHRPDVLAERVSNAIESLGKIEFRILPEADQLAVLGTDLDAETGKLESWRAANPDAPLGTFNLVAAAEGGPEPRIAWLTRSWPPGESKPAAILIPESFEACFGYGDFERASLAFDSSGYPAIGFEFKPSVRQAFSDFTGDNVERQMAIAIDDVIVSAPRIGDRLPGAGIIRSDWTDEAEVRALVAALEAGEPPLRRVR
jgi:preprotein translocase subunit SecD